MALPSSLSSVERTPQQQQAFETLLREVKELRPLPVIALRLIAMAEDARFSAQDLAETIRTDQALTLKILRLSNSPAFGLPRRITSLREAIVLLGFREVRSMALGACVVDSGAPDRLEAAQLDYDQFWMNSLVVAHLAQALAPLERVDRDEAFTAGVVHNVGRLALAQHRPEWMASAVAEAARGGVSVRDVQVAHLGFSDNELGGAIARSWSFPAGLVDAVEHHHRPLSELPDRRGLDSIVARARRFARAHQVTDGIDASGPSMVPDTEWQVPIVREGLLKVGGMEGILERVRAYVHDEV